jgi:hypothetical protein
MLGDAGETRELTWRDELLELLPVGLPALRGRLVGRSPEEIVREVTGPKDANSASRSCSSGVAFRASSSISSISRIAAMLSAARVFPSGARRRAHLRGSCGQE